MPFYRCGGGADTSGVTAEASDVLSPKVIVDANGNPLTGTIPSKGAQTYTPTTADQTITAKQYLSGTQTIKGDANLKAENIVSGKSIFGVAGNAAKVTIDGKEITGDKKFSSKWAVISRKNSIFPSNNVYISNFFGAATVAGELYTYVNNKLWKYQGNKLIDQNVSISDISTPMYGSMVNCGGILYIACISGSSNQTTYIYKYNGTSITRLQICEMTNKGQGSEIFVGLADNNGNLLIVTSQRIIEFNLNYGTLTEIISTFPSTTIASDSIYSVVNWAVKYNSYLYVGYNVGTMFRYNANGTLTRLTAVGRRVPTSRNSQMFYVDFALRFIVGYDKIKNMPILFCFQGGHDSYYNDYYCTISTFDGTSWSSANECNLTWSVLRYMSSGRTSPFIMFLDSNNTLVVDMVRESVNNNNIHDYFTIEQVLA